MASWTKTVTSKPLFQNTFILRRPRVADFAYTIETETMSMKTILSDSKRVKRFRNYALKCNRYMYLLI